MNIHTQMMVGLKGKERADCQSGDPQFPLKGFRPGRGVDRYGQNGLDRLLEAAASRPRLLSFIALALLAAACAPADAATTPPAPGLTIHPDADGSPWISPTALPEAPTAISLTEIVIATLLKPTDVAEISPETVCDAQISEQTLSGLPLAEEFTGWQPFQDETNRQLAAAGSQERVNIGETLLAVNKLLPDGGKTQVMFRPQAGWFIQAVAADGTPLWAAENGRFHDRPDATGSIDGKTVELKSLPKVLGKWTVGKAFPVIRPECSPSVTYVWMSDGKARLEFDPGIGQWRKFQAATETPAASATATPTLNQFATEVAEIKATGRAPKEPLWDMSRPLPPLHSQNAAFEPDQQGGGVVHFTNEGRRYALEIPRPELIDGAGNKIEGGNFTIEFHRPSPDEQRVPTSPPKIAFIGPDGQEYGWYDLENRQWLPRYRTLFVRDSYQPLPEAIGIGGDLGFERDVKENLPFNEGGFVDHYITFSGRVRRMYEEKVWNPFESRLSTLTWATVTYDKAETDTLELLVFTDREYAPRSEGTPSMQEVAITDGTQNYAGSNIIPKVIYSNRHILETLERSSFVKVRIITVKDEEIADVKNESRDRVLGWLFDVNPIQRQIYFSYLYQPEHRGVVRNLIKDYLNRPKLKALDEELKAKGVEPIESGVRFGYDILWIYVPASTSAAQTPTP